MRGLWFPDEVPVSQAPTDGKGEEGPRDTKDTWFLCMLRPVALFSLVLSWK